jgi:hypothetical protein
MCLCQLLPSRRTVTKHKMLRLATPHGPRQSNGVKPRLWVHSNSSFRTSNVCRFVQTKKERRKELRNDGKEFMKIILQKNKEEEVRFFQVNTSKKFYTMAGLKAANTTSEKMKYLWAMGKDFGLRIWNGFKQLYHNTKEARQLKKQKKFKKSPFNILGTGKC